MVTWHIMMLLFQRSRLCTGYVYLLIKLREIYYSPKINGSRKTHKYNFNKLKCSELGCLNLSENFFTHCYRKHYALPPVYLSVPYHTFRPISRRTGSKLTGSLLISHVTLGQKFKKSKVKNQGNKTDWKRNVPEITMDGRTVLSSGCGIAPLTVNILFFYPRVPLGVDNYRPTCYNFQMKRHMNVKFGD